MHMHTHTHRHSPSLKRRLEPIRSMASLGHRARRVTQSSSLIDTLNSPRDRTSGPASPHMRLMLCVSSISTSFICMQQWKGLCFSFLDTYTVYTVLPSRSYFIPGIISSDVKLLLCPRSSTLFLMMNRHSILVKTTTLYFLCWWYCEDGAAEVVWAHEVNEKQLSKEGCVYAIRGKEGNREYMNWSDLECHQSECSESIGEKP